MYSYAFKVYRCKTQRKHSPEVYLLKQWQWTKLCRYRIQTTTLYNTVNWEWDTHNTTYVSDQNLMVDGNEKTLLQLYHMLQDETP